jgi:hypothetical protein
MDQQQEIHQIHCNSQPFWPQKDWRPTVVNVCQDIRIDEAIEKIHMKKALIARDSEAKVNKLTPHTVSK